MVCIRTGAAYEGRVDVANVFRELLINGYIPRSNYDSAAVVRCHEHGWIHVTHDEDEVAYYIFPSPLHQAFLSWS